jgi:uncharacterized membrane protein|tara:strand:+ start:91 stop:369 length:279 start_codon:yes stop_codon:yes gene_type:complete
VKSLRRKPMSDLLCAKNDQSTTIKKFKELLNSLSSEELLKLSKQTKVIKKTTPTLSFQEEYKKVVIKCMNSKRSKNLIHHTLAEQMRNSKTK